MNISDDMLMAYADGELDMTQRAEVERAIALDSQLAARVAQHQRLRNQVQGAFAQIVSEPVPDRLLATLRQSSTATANDAASHNVIAFKIRPASIEKTESNQARNRWSWPQWGALAASLIVGAICGMVALSVKNSDVVTARNGALQASGSLAQALNQQLSGAHDNARIQMQLSFVARSGEYCRSFVIKEQQSLAGLACREGNAWRVPMLTTTLGSDATYRQAGSELPSAVLQWMDTERVGDALDAPAERAARESGWKK